MTVRRITLACNGPVTDQGPISQCDAYFTAGAYVIPLARKHAATEGWVNRTDEDCLVLDFCPNCAGDPAVSDERASGA